MVSSSGSSITPPILLHSTHTHTHTHTHAHMIFKIFPQFDLHYDQAPPSFSADYKLFEVRIQGIFIFISLEMPYL